ncbi:MAG: GNAT family N-acetyltransferase [Chitinispirillaceae bacterium]|nr:GNAT family N-acetyltransferase [Chitinispirillaceae bacterium]
MEYEHEFVNPVGATQWDEFVAGSENYSFFHSSLWAKTLVDTYGFLPFYYLGKTGGKPVAAIPLMEVANIFGQKHGVSLPFSDFCLPIYSDKPAFDAAFESVKGLAKKRKWRSISLRGNAPFTIDEKKTSFCFRHIVPLQSDVDGLFAKLKGKTRVHIRKAIKSGVTVTFDTSFDAMEMFYRLNCRTRKRHGLPPQPFSFFKNFHRILIASGHGEIALGTYDNRVICTDIFLHSGTAAYYKYGASDAAFNRTGSNYLILWEAIKKYNDLGYEKLCLGRTEASHSGLLQFKAGWGAEQYTVRTYIFDVARDKFIRTDLKTSGIHNAFFSRMPVSLLRLLGTLFYRYMG